MEESYHIPDLNIKNLLWSISCPKKKEMGPIIEFYIELYKEFNIKNSTKSNVNTKQNRYQKKTQKTAEYRR